MNTQNIDLYLQMSIQSLGLIVSNPPSSDSYTGSIKWDFSSFENPPFMPSAFPILIADVVSNGFNILRVYYNQNLINHTPGVVTISQFYISGNSKDNNEGYLGGYSDIDVIFSISGNMGSNLAISIDFPSSWDLDSYCEVIGTSIFPIAGD